MPGVRVIFDYFEKDLRVYNSMLFCPFLAVRQSVVDPGGHLRGQN